MSNCQWIEFDRLVQAMTLESQFEYLWQFQTLTLANWNIVQYDNLRISPSKIHWKLTERSYSTAILMLLTPPNNELHRWQEKTGFQNCHEMYWREKSAIYMSVVRSLYHSLEEREFQCFERIGWREPHCPYTVQHLIEVYLVIDDARLVDRYQRSSRVIRTSAEEAGAETVTTTRFFLIITFFFPLFHYAATTTSPRGARTTRCTRACRQGKGLLTWAVRTQTCRAWAWRTLSRVLCISKWVLALRAASRAASIRNTCSRFTNLIRATSIFSSTRQVNC